MAHAVFERLLARVQALASPAALPLHALPASALAALFSQQQGQGDGAPVVGEARRWVREVVKEYGEGLLLCGDSEAAAEG
jgi:hypothetical protein